MDKAKEVMLGSWQVANPRLQFTIKFPLCTGAFKAVARQPSKAVVSLNKQVSLLCFFGLVTPPAADVARMAVTFKQSYFLLLSSIARTCAH